MKFAENPTLYSYCIPYDNGAAPNPYWGICTLVICKPKIRKAAQVGDWVIGIGPKNSPIGDISNYVVYTMKITSKMTIREYDEFCKKIYTNKIPDWNSSDFRRRVGDCIYDFSDPINLKIRNGVYNEKNKEKDLGGKFALISKHFYYFGDKPIKLLDNLKPIIKQGQGRKFKSNDPHVKDFIYWIENLGLNVNNIHGEPQLKKEFLKDNNICSKCSNYRYKEAIDDEKIGFKNC